MKDGIARWSRRDPGGEKKSLFPQQPRRPIEVDPDFPSRKAPAERGASDQTAFQVSLGRSAGKFHDRPGDEGGVHGAPAEINIP